MRSLVGSKPVSLDVIDMKNGSFQETLSRIGSFFVPTQTGANRTRTRGRANGTQILSQA